MLRESTDWGRAGRGEEPLAYARIPLASRKYSPGYPTLGAAICSFPPIATTMCVFLPDLLRAGAGRGRLSFL